MKKKELIPLVTFRIYIYKSSLYYKIYVWKFKKEMQSAGTHNGLRGNNYAGFCASFRIIKQVGKVFRKTKQLGEIHLWKRQLGIEVLSHESTHAILNTLNEMKFDFSKLRVNNESELVTLREETLCLLIGKFTRALGTKFHNLGFYK